MMYDSAPPDVRAEVDAILAQRRRELASATLAATLDRVRRRNQLLRTMILNGARADTARDWRALYARVRLHDITLLFRAELPDDVPLDLAPPTMISTLLIGWKALRQAYERNTKSECRREAEKPPETDLMRGLWSG